MSETKYTHSQATCEILILHQVLQIHVKCKRIVGNFRGRKLSRRKLLQISEKYDFTEKTFVVSKDAMPPNFVKKIFAKSQQTTKFGKVFSLESFLLYGNQWGGGGLCMELTAVLQI